MNQTFDWIQTLITESFKQNPLLVSLQKKTYFYFSICFLIENFWENLLNIHWVWNKLYLSVSYGYNLWIIGKYFP